MSDTVNDTPAENPAAEATQGATTQSAALSLPAQVESLLYASKEPVTINALATTLEVTTREVEDAVEQLAEQYQWRGIRIQRNANRIQLVTAPEVAAKIQRFLGLEEINRLSAAALETLAIIAYNQPVTKPQIEMIRGVNCDGVMNTLEARNLIVELGRSDGVGHPMRYGVSFDFLQYFGLKSTHELPPVNQLETLPITPALPAAPESAETAPVAPVAPVEQPVAQTDADTATP